MGIYHIFIVSKSGGLIFNYDHNIPQLENEKVKLERHNKSLRNNSSCYTCVLTFYFIVVWRVQENIKINDFIDDNVNNS